LARKGPVADNPYLDLNYSIFFFHWLIENVQLQTENPFTPNRRDIFLIPPTPLEIPSFINFLKFFGLTEPSSPRKFKSLLLGILYFLELYFYYIFQKTKH